MFDRPNPDRPIADLPTAELLLADGSACFIRPSGPQDRDLLVRCFEALSPQSRRMRFFSDKQRLTPQDLDLFCGVDGYDHLALAAVRIDRAGRELEPLGFARCLRLAPGGATAELSVTVVDRFQGQGIGTRLLDRLIAAAREQGIRRFRFEVLMENAGMRRLAARLGGETRWLGGGTLEFDCPLPHPYPADLAPEPDTLPLPRRTGKVPAQREPALPWYLDPALWIDPWTETWTRAWEVNLDRFLAWSRAANEDIGHWLEGEHPLAARPWREAA